MNTVRHLVDSGADSHGGAVYLIDPLTGTSITYRMLQTYARGMAEYLHNQDLPPGCSVAYAMSNGVHSAVCVLAILYSGYRATAINLVAGQQTIAYVLDHSEACLIFTQTQHRDLLSQATGSLDPVLAIPEILFDDTFLQSLGSQPDSRESSKLPLGSVLEGDDALLMYTSGTTGVPKGVVLSQANLVAGGDNTRIAHQLNANDRALCVLPLYHINGLCVTLMGPLASGGSVVLPERFSTRLFWHWVHDNQCTWFSVVPTQISYLLHAEAEPAANARLRFGRSASAPLAPDVQNAFESRFAIPVIETMGLTETAAQILSNPLPPGERKIGSPGVAFGVEVMIANASQESVPVNTEGELLVRGSNVMQRYFRNPEATQACLLDNGWLRTGDLGRLDSDGYVFITGRSKELIIKGGENIAPREVDEALYKHPEVIEAAAFAQPCARYGQRVEAAVALKLNSVVGEAELIALCATLVGDFKKPDRIHFLSELPKGPSGKIQRIKLGEILAQV